MISDERKEEINKLETRTLIEVGMDTQEKSKELYDDLTYIKFILTQRMRRDRASILAHPTIECKGKKDATSWDYGRLALVREELDKADVDLFYIPEHEETISVKERYDMRVGNGFKKYGGKVKELIENATVLGEVRDVQLKRKD